MVKYTDADISGALTHLLRYLHPGARVYTILRHTARSGMQHQLSLYVLSVDQDTGQVWPIPLTSAVCMFLGKPCSSYEGHTTIKVNDCGMDMGFATVYKLSRALYPDGFIPALSGHPGRNGADPNEVDLDGGYALKHSWL